MSLKNKILLLHIIESKGNIKRLLRENLSYKDISELLEILVNDELIEYNKEKILLTKKGNNYLIENTKLIKKTDKKLWISPEIESKIPQLDKNFIFLPNQDEIHFSDL